MPRTLWCFSTALMVRNLSARLSLWTPNPLASTRAPLGSAAMPREQSKKRTEEQTKQKAELQNLRMQINRLRRKGGDTEGLLQELRDKEKSYERGKKRSLGPMTLREEAFPGPHDAATQGTS